MPLEIKPEGLNINDYDIKFDQQKNIVIAIRNLKLHADVKWRDLNVESQQGWVAGTSVDIWTEVIDFETLNIIHIHVNDMSDSITMDVRYVNEG